MIGIIRVKETQQNEKGKTMYRGVEDTINKLGALGIKKAGVKGYGVEVPDIVARTLEYHRQSANFSNVLYGEGGKEDKDRAITRNTMFVKLREDQIYGDTMKKLRREVEVRETGVRVVEVRNIRDKEIAIRFTEREEGGNKKMREKVARCLETKEIRMASERTGTILRVLEVDETVGDEEIESAIEQIARKEAKRRKLFKVVEWSGEGGEIKRKWKGINVETTNEIGRVLQDVIWQFSFECNRFLDMVVIRANYQIVSDIDRAAFEPIIDK
ncbi:hypothetical protein FQA39_LY05224 [Lamprigera yunnana]|nr:hypothetical protein FQA39_LY05224 [Lamprigera yunnana]